ncbi:MAG: Gfo/Idh/MocA family oxidoreductase [Planctomycetes bacterium]|nr:Gfo/Idh/MocA family oxidoreductase [Planctomycetota bacterium]
MPKPLNIALIGTGFMGRAHSNAWMSVNKFFDLPRVAVMHTVCARESKDARRFARKWGWAEATTDLGRVIDDPTIDLVDIATPNHLHAPQAVAALEAGKHVACEKPLAGRLDDAQAMRVAAQRAKRRGIGTFVWFNYRRCPAVAFAHQLVRKGRLGRIYHVRAQYLQDWGGPQTSLSWRFDVTQAGSGAHGDLNAHIVDMARFITADEITEIAGAIAKTFITRRPLAEAGRGRKTRYGRSTVDDCALFLARFKSGAVGSFEATRLATGNLNRNCMEINAERGSIKFDFERMNELLWWDNTLESSLRGWSRIMCTNPGDHPYAEAYGPPGHPLGYDHQFISQAADIIKAIAGRKPIVALADFEDACRTQKVLHAALVSAREHRAVKISEV